MNSTCNPANTLRYTAEQYITLFIVGLLLIILLVILALKPINVNININSSSIGHYFIIAIQMYDVVAIHVILYSIRALRH